MKHLLIYQARTTTLKIPIKERIAAVAIMKMSEKQYREYGGKSLDEKRRGNPTAPAQRNSPFGWLALVTDGEREISFNYFLDAISKSEYETYKIFKLPDGVVEHNDNKGGPVFVCHTNSKHLEEIEKYSNRPTAFKEPT